MSNSRQGMLFKRSVHCSKWSVCSRREKEITSCTFVIHKLLYLYSDKSLFSVEKEKYQANGMNVEQLLLTSDVGFIWNEPNEWLKVLILCFFTVCPVCSSFPQISLIFLYFFRLPVCTVFRVSVGIIKLLQKSSPIFRICLSIIAVHRMRHRYSFCSCLYAFFRRCVFCFIWPLYGMSSSNLYKCLIHEDKII